MQQQLWASYGSSSGNAGALDGYLYAYDADGNRTTQINSTNGNLDYQHTYDSIDRLTSATRNDGFHQTWGLDALGNFTNFNDNGANETRTTDPANEIQSINDQATPAYDLAGNMITTPSPLPSGAGQGEGCTYDAWNRLVSVTGGAAPVAYYYDGTGRLVETAASGGTTTYSYYDGQNAIETRVNGTAASNVQYQYVYSPLGDGKTPILRDSTFNGNAPTDTGRLYYLTDANSNVTAVVGYNTTGVPWQVAERYAYDAYGSVTVCDPTWTTVRGTSLANSAVGNTVGFASMVFDPNTGLYNDEARWYSTAVSTFISRDPALADENLYRYCGNMPTDGTDPSGLREAAKPFEYVKGAMDLQISGPHDGAQESGDMLSSDITLTGKSIVASFFDKKGCPLATEVGFIQITSSRIDISGGWWGPSVLYLDIWGNRGWHLDGKVPFGGHSIDPTKLVDKIGGIGEQVIMTDVPGISTGQFWFGSTVFHFSQTFETHLVCIKGAEKGATYGGVQWGHSFDLKPGFNGTSINNYNVRRWATRTAAPSPEFKKIVGAALGLKLP